MMKIFTKRILSVVIVLFSMIITHNAYSQYGSWSLSPAPQNGQYEPGDVVTVCFTLQSNPLSGANWLHGLMLDIPSGWDMSSITNTSAPPSCTGSGGGNWAFYATGPYGPGFYYDSGTGGPLDGNPFNNWGDPCSTNQIPVGFTFCFTITVGFPNGDGTFDCGPQGTYFDGADISLGIQITGDGETGSWGVNYAPQPTVPTVEITIKCCEAEAGVSPGTIYICENGNFNLFDQLLPNADGDNPDIFGEWTYTGEPGYSWTNPWSPSLTPWLGTFDPTVDPPGDYTYTVSFTDPVTNEICESSTTITMEYINLGEVQSIPDCSGTPSNLNPLITNIVVPAGGIWTDPIGTTLVGDLVDPDVNPPGTYTYVYYDGSNCKTIFTIELIFATGGAAGSSGTVDICTSDAGCFSPFSGLEGNPSAGGNWIVWDSLKVMFVDYLADWDTCLNMATYPSSLLGGAGYYGDFTFEYILGAFPCEPAQVIVDVNIYNPVNTGANTETTLCVTDAPVALHTLIGAEPGLQWTQGGDSISDIFDPSGFAPNTSLSLYYSGGLSGTSCENTTLLQLTILPTYAYAGENNTIFVCQSDAPIFMRDSLGSNGSDVAQSGGIWYNNLGVDINTEYFVPAMNPPGTYVFDYHIVSPCAADQSTLTIIIEPTPDPGISGTLDICSADIDISLMGGLTGTPQPGGIWTSPIGDIVPGGLVNGNTVIHGEVYTYTLGTLCEQTATATINLTPTPNAGVLTTTPQEYCDSDAPINLMTLFTTNPSIMPAPGVAGWTGPSGPIPAPYIINPSAGSSLSGVYTYTIQDAGCGIASTSITITINDTPSAGTDGTLTVCPNSTAPVDLFLSLGGTPAAAGTWTDPFNNPFSGSFNPTTPDAAGVYTYTVGTACSDQSTVTVSYSVLPNPGTSNSITVCAGDPPFNLINEMGGGAIQGVWSNSTNPNFGNVFNPAVHPAGVYTNTVNAGSCPSVSATLTIIVDPLPNAGTSASVTFCETSGFVDLRSYLGDTPEPGGIWTDAGGGIVPNSLDVSTLCGNSYVYTYTVGSGTCSSSAVLSFDVVCTPSAGTNGTINVCSDGAVFSLFDGLNGSYDANGIWYNGLNVQVVNPTAMNPASLGVGDTYTYTVEASPCAAASATVDVSITPAMSTANLDVSCTPSQTTYIVSFEILGGNGSYTVSGNPVFGNVFTSAPIPAGTPYNFTISDGSPCGDITVSGNSPTCICPATASFASGNTTICVGNTTGIELDLGGGIDGNYSFEYSDGTNTYTVSNASDGQIITVNPTVTTTYTLVSVSDGFCSIPATGSVTVTVDPLNNAGNDVPLFYCGDGTNLVLTPAPGEPLGGTFSPASVMLTAANSGVQATYTVSGGQCPSDVATYTINIDAPITATASTNCAPNQTEYDVTIVISGGTAPYTVNNNPIIGNSFTSAMIPMGTGYNFVIGGSGVCSDVTVSGNSPNCNCPVNASFNTGNQTICIGSSTDIGLNLTGGVDGNYSITYSVGGVAQPPLTGLSNGDVITVSPTATTTYVLTGVEDNNCQGSANGSVTITVEQLPNAGADVSANYCADGSILVFTPGAGQPVGGSFSPASIIKDVANSGVYLYTMDGNVCPDDQANYTVNFIQELDATNHTAVCASNQLTYTVSFTIIGGTPPYSINGGSPTYSTNFSETLVFANNPTYSYTISDNGPCADVVISETAPDCNCIAQGSINGSQAICNGEGAMITFNGTGDGPFNIAYTNSVTNETTTLNAINNGHIITVYPTVTTTYTLTSVSDSYCEGDIIGNAVTVTVNNPVVISDVTEICNNTAEGYRVQFSYSGGIAPISFVPANTSTTPGVYISPVYTSGTGYNITVNDAGACSQQVVSSPIHTCDCLSYAGLIPTSNFEVCYGETASVSAMNTNLDANDALQYILHDGANTPIGNIIGTSADGSFTFNYGSMSPGAVYFITAVVGNNLGGGNVNLNGLCTSFSNPVEVVMNPLPTASISGGGIVCVGESIDLTVTFTGEAPFDFAYAIDGVEQAPNTVTNGNSFILSVTQAGTYTLVSVSDNNCVGSVSGTATFQNYAPPTGNLTGAPTVCEGSGDGPQVTFTGNGPWNFIYSINGVDQPPVTTNFQTYTIPAEVDGTYSLISVEGSYCPGTASGSQHVTILAAPTASISGGGTVCAGDAATFNVNLTGASPWTVHYTVDGVPQNPLTNITSGYSFESSVDGDYVLVSVNDANCQGEVLTSQAALVVNPLPTAQVTSNKTTLCIGEELQLGIDLEGVPPYNVTYVINGDTTTATGLYSDYMQTLMPQNPITFEVIHVSDGSNPTCASNVSDLTYINAVVLPNAPVLTNDTICATSGPVSIGVSPAPGLTYSWSPETSLSNPMAANTLYQPFLQGPVAKNFTYVLTATNGICSASDTMTITVDPGPKARFTYSPDPISSEDPTVFFKNTTIGGSEVIYFWEFDSLDTSHDFEPSYKFPDGINDSYAVTLTALDPVTGCIDDYTDILNIKPEMLIFVPNAFTPDADGKNDLWAPVLTNVDPDNYKLSVYDRLGSLVFTTTDIKQKWNGNKMNGDYYVEPGVYVWMIETKNEVSLEEVNMKGIVTVVR